LFAVGLYLKLFYSSFSSYFRSVTDGVLMCLAS